MHSASFSRSSSRNWSGASCSSSSSSVGPQESRDDIESYLSMFKGKEGKREVGHTVDWGKLLDGGKVLESTEGLQDRVSEEGERDEEAVSMFLKPNAKANLPSPKHPRQKHSDTRCSDRSDSRKTMHSYTGRQNNHSNGRSLRPNVTMVSSRQNTEPGEEDISTSTNVSTERSSRHERGHAFVPKDAHNSDGRLLECTQSQKLDDSVRLGVRRNGFTATTSQDSRHNTELSNTRSTSEESESELSFSGIFKNNVFSLDQLEAPVQPPESRGNQLSPSNSSTNSATEEEDDDWEPHLPYTLHSLTELGSPTAERGALRGREGADDAEQREMRVVAAGTPQGHRLGTEESDGESSSKDEPHEADLKSEGDSEVLSYEEDFESSTMSESDQELGTNVSSASGAQEERGEETFDEKSTEEQEDHEGSTHERKQQRTSMGQWAGGSAEHTLASSGVGSAGGVDDKSGLHRGRLEHNGPSKQEGKEQAPPSPEDKAAQVDSHGTLRPTPLPTHPEQDHLHPSPLTPLTITADTSASSLVSDTLQDLLRAQLALTKHLITRSRTLAEEISASLTPNYHYTTLEETKRYISENRPKVLTSEEAREIVSREDNHGHSFL